MTRCVPDETLQRPAHGVSFGGQAADPWHLRANRSHTVSEHRAGHQPGGLAREVLGVALCREVDPIRVPEPTVIAPHC